MTYEIKPFDCLCGAQPTIHFRVDGFHVYCTTPQPDCWRRPSALSSDRDTAIWLWNEEIHKSVRAQHLGAAVTPIVRDQLGLNELATHDEVRAAIADLQTTVASQKLDIRHEKSIASAARSDAQQWRGAYDTAQQQAQQHEEKLRNIQEELKRTNDSLKSMEFSKQRIQECWNESNAALETATSEIHALKTDQEATIQRNRALREILGLPEGAPSQTVMHRTVWLRDVVAEVRGLLKLPDRASHLEITTAIRELIEAGRFGAKNLEKAMSEARSIREALGFNENTGTVRVLASIERLREDLDAANVLLESADAFEADLVGALDLAGNADHASILRRVGQLGQKEPVSRDRTLNTSRRQDVLVHRVKKELGLVSADGSEEFFTDPTNIDSVENDERIILEALKTQKARIAQQLEVLRETSEALGLSSSPGARMFDVDVFGRNRIRACREAEETLSVVTSLLGLPWEAPATKTELIAAVGTLRAKARILSKLKKEIQALYVVFDGPPGHESGRFVEVETEHGRSVRAEHVRWWKDARAPHEAPRATLWPLGPFTQLTPLMRQLTGAGDRPFRLIREEGVSGGEKEVETEKGNETNSSQGD